jgi:hypothetical protein
MASVHPLQRIVAALHAQAHSVLRFYITVLPIDGKVMTFGMDNWHHMAPLTDALIRDGVVSQEDVPTCVVVVRRFDGAPPPGEDLPPKTVAGFLLTGTQIHALTAEQQREDSETDSRTGLPLEPEPMVTYAHGLDMLPQLRGHAIELRRAPRMIGYRETWGDARNL